MKIIKTDGIFNFEEIVGSGGWYWCCDYASGDLYEAEEIFKDGRPLKSNRIVFVHYPDGKVIEPIKAKEGQYLGRPVFDGGNLKLPLVDFPKSMIYILSLNCDSEEVSREAEISLFEVKNCYNLMLMQSPLMLTRQGFDNLFEVVWPEKISFSIGSTESFCSRDGDKLYFSRWFEDPDYRDETVIRQYPDGKVLEIIPGALMEMPDGQKWIVR